MTSDDTAHNEGTSANRQAATLELRGITKRYPGADEAAIDNLSLEVAAGEICVLVGPSGCGKTTAMRLVNRMIEPTSGDILVNGVSIIDRKPSELRREIGYAIQQIGLFPHQTIAENIATVPKLLGWEKKRIVARVDELMDLIGLEAAMARRYPGQLSGGQRQRVGVARALAADPPLMLMDEPFGAIDPINRERLQNEFLRLQGEIRKTIVFVTHDIDEAIKMGDRIAVLRKGGILAQYATPAELLMAPADAFVEDFVGADRALKRLALQRVRDIELWDAPTVRVGDPMAEARERAMASPIRHALLVDDDGRPVSWLGDTDLTGDRVVHHDGRVTMVELDDILRDALADLLQGQVMFGVVTDHGGRVAGVLSVEVISEFLTHQTAGHIDEAPAPAERLA
ncbi:Osmoprotectant import ATP-binding protein OsmV [Paraconexibacter sp. AEG42_29]|uniref:ABC-type quaternary amine transporter n=1 Tax=Paraconexibacter sp. AEG42_29 TaxID=2997339 RepID=A0AAU7AW60_9ACTN